MDMKISEILREAADVYLWDGTGHDDDPLQDKHEFSCHAIGAVYGQASLDRTPAHAFYAELGTYMAGSGFIDTRSTAMLQLSRRDGTERRFEQFERQQVRYAWMMFAADRAEEEGL